MGKRKQPVTRDQIIAAAGALLASSSGGMPATYQTSAWALGLGLLAWAAIR